MTSDGSFRFLQYFNISGKPFTVKVFGYRTDITPETAIITKINEKNDIVQMVHNAIIWS